MWVIIINNEILLEIWHLYRSHPQITPPKIKPKNKNAIPQSINAYTIGSEERGNMYIILTLSVLPPKIPMRR